VGQVSVQERFQGPYRGGQITLVGVLSASLWEEDGILENDLEASDLLLADGQTPRRGITRDHSRVQFLKENL
jgi:hypothetical protein